MATRVLHSLFAIAASLLAAAALAQNLNSMTIEDAQRLFDAQRAAVLRRTPPVDPVPWSKLQTGMTSEEVLALLGPPLDAQTRNGGDDRIETIWTYHYEQGAMRRLVRFGVPVTSGPMMVATVSNLKLDDFKASTGGGTLYYWTGQTPASAADFPLPGSRFQWLTTSITAATPHRLGTELGKRLAERWSVDFGVDSHYERHGHEALVSAFKSAGDGTSVLIVSISDVFTARRYPDAAAVGDLGRDLKTLALAGATPQVLLVRAGGPVATLADLLALAKERPLVGCTGALGSLPHLAQEMFAELTATRVDTLLSTSTGLSCTKAVAAGQADLLFTAAAADVNAARGGALRALLVAGSARLATLPDVPTAAEAGLPALVAESWFGFLTAGSTPDELVQRLGNEITAGLRDSRLLERANAQSLGTRVLGPTEAQAFLRAELSRWSALQERRSVAAESATPGQARPIRFRARLGPGSLTLFPSQGGSIDVRTGMSPRLLNALAKDRGAVVEARSDNAFAVGSSVLYFTDGKLTDIEQ